MRRLPDACSISLRRTMSSDSEGDDYVYYGTPLEQEAASSYYVRPAGAQAVPKTVALPVHQQQVRDEQGRQRLHGAFTGGFSAGHYNNVGSLVRARPLFEEQQCA